MKKGFSELRYGFSKSKINEYRRSLYNIKKPKNVTEKSLLELEKKSF